MIFHNCDVCEKDIVGIEELLFSTNKTHLNSQNTVELLDAAVT